ncbi:hypothetical protein RHSIM_Rhsim05G0135000 [Rhododendron simsii]|uniref:NB-ARC domain-containing protein n=1 Tax=Rhododendron simsii TaxID=118357 RepID=A0A834LPN4_RHOSS|nr:hypothetical protein RHSIM_Rhsim05G0135000 [Rhododendron simsii]
MCTPQGIIEKVGCLVFDEAVKAAIEKGKYVIGYKTNLKELQVEIRKLDDHREIIQRKVHEANNDGKSVYTAVSDWPKDADAMTRDVHDQQLVGQTEADRMTPDVEEQLVGQTEVDGVIRDVQEQLVGQTEADGVTRDIQEQLVGQSYDTGNMSYFKWPPPPKLEFPSNENYVDLDSRTPAFKRIVDALKDPGVNVIGVHGLGGDSKTTLVEEVSKKMRHDRTFKQVTLTVVSKDLNVKEIQSKLADRLDFKVDATLDEKGRATHEFFYVDPVGLSGGLALWWTNDVGVNIELANKNLMHVVVNDKATNAYWASSFVYGCPSRSGCQEVWDSIKSIARLESLPWLCMGDFNQVLTVDDKFGGHLPSQNALSSLHDMISADGLVDLEFKGHIFTWRNNRSEGSFIMERIDMAFANSGWRELYEHAMVFVEAAVGSDHNPLILNTDVPLNKVGKPFRFESFWLSDEECSVVISEAWNQG